MDSTTDILKRGYVDVKVFVSGLRQSHRLTIEMQKTPNGDVPYLVCKYYIPTPELMRIAEMTKLPVRHRDIVAFPKGKAPSDYTKSTEPVAVAEASVVEAEIE